MFSLTFLVSSPVISVSFSLVTRCVYIISVSLYCIVPHTYMLFGSGSEGFYSVSEVLHCRFQIWLLAQHVHDKGVIQLYKTPLTQEEKPRLLLQGVIVSQQFTVQAYDSSCHKNQCHGSNRVLRYLGALQHGFRRLEKPQMLNN